MAEWELWEGGPFGEPNFGPLDGFARIERPQLEKQFVPIASEGYRHWDFLKVASLEKLVGPAIQMILVSPVAEIVVTVGPESD